MPYYSPAECPVEAYIRGEGRDTKKVNPASGNMTEPKNLWNVRAFAAGTIATLVLATIGAAQFVWIARWRNSAKGAYSICMDDHCTQHFGDINIIDSLTANRGVNL